MILLFTDYGLAGPYVGQLHAVLAAAAPGVPVIDLQHDAPAFSPQAAGLLLAALARDLPAGCTVVAVVDPGVGSARRALLLEAGGRRYLGPDNGLLAPLAASDPEARAWSIEWRPERLSASFHGRDLFAPAAARLLRDEALPRGPLPPADLVGAGAPAALAAVIYLDGFGNAWTGLPAASLPPGTQLRAGGRQLRRARSFSDVEKGEAFWYENAAGLAEIAVNQGSAEALLGLSPGDRVEVRLSDGKQEETP